MAKSKAKNNGKILYFVAALLGLVAVCMLFVTAVKYQTSSSSNTAVLNEFTGLQTVFGYSEKTLLGTTELLKFSFLNLLPYLFALVGVVLAIMGAVKGGKSGLMDWIVVALFVVAGILFFCSASFVVTDLATGTVLGTTTEFVLGAGTIIAGITSVLSAIVVLVKKFMK